MGGVYPQSYPFHRRARHGNTGGAVSQTSALTIILSILALFSVNVPKEVDLFHNYIKRFILLSPSIYLQMLNYIMHTCTIELAFQFCARAYFEQNNIQQYIIMAEEVAKRESEFSPIATPNDIKVLTFDQAMKKAGGLDKALINICIKLQGPNIRGAEARLGLVVRQASSLVG